MFIKTTRVRDAEYIKLVESYRDCGKTKHRVLYNFGRADLIRNDDSFLRIVKRLCEVAQIPIANNKRDDDSFFDDCTEAELYNYGYLAYLRLWQELGIADCLEDVQSIGKTGYSIPETAFLMALQHLLEPMSKLQTYSNQNRYFKMPKINLHQMYRTLDKLSEQKEEIETGLFEYNYIRVDKKVDVVFYDVTTIHFESAAADELRDFGFSKNCKFNEVQVVLGMIIDAAGMPAGYELFKGNTFDGKTMVKALANIKKRFGIKRVIIVADRGLNSKDNLKLIKEAGYGYIMAAKIKGAAADLQDKIFSGEGFTDVKDNNGAFEFRYKVIEYENIFIDKNRERQNLPENMVISWSPKRAKKDKADRERLIEKAKLYVENPEKISASNKRGGKKYIEEVKPANGKHNKISYALALEKIEKDAKFDGYYAIQTSEKTMTAAEVMGAYHTLWKIEESFRIMKTTLELRPVYHYSPKRIEGHFVVCFLAFLMERKMELLLKNETGEDVVSPNRIRAALNTMQLAAVDTKTGKKYIKAKYHPLGAKIFKRLKINTPNNISDEETLVSGFKLNAERFPAQISLL